MAGSLIATASDVQSSSMLSVATANGTSPTKTVSAHSDSCGFGKENNDSNVQRIQGDQELSYRQQQYHSTQQQQKQLYDDLEFYLLLLPRFRTSINAILDAEYNSSPQKATDVLKYYQDRPALFEYTLEQELPRMNYTIILPSNTNDDNDNDKPRKIILQNSSTRETTRVIADYLRVHVMNDTVGSDDAATARGSDTSMQHILIRASNQSLLADCLQCLIGPDRLIRPQYMATAVATSCHFVVNLLGSDEDADGQNALPSVHVTAEFSLFLPTKSGGRGDRWKIADFTIVAQFILPYSHQPPVINYRLLSICPCNTRSHFQDSTTWQRNLTSTVAMLAELDMVFPPCCSSPVEQGLGTNEGSDNNDINSSRSNIQQSWKRFGMGSLQSKLAESRRGMSWWGSSSSSSSLSSSCSLGS